MKYNTNELKNAVDVIKSVVPTDSNTSKQVIRLSNDNYIESVSVDTGIACRIKLSPTSLDEPEEFFFDRKKFCQVVSSLSGNEVEIKKDEDLKAVRFINGKTKFMLTLCESEANEVPYAKGDYTVVLNGKSFADELECCAYAMLAETTRPILHGIRLSMHDSIINLTATDSYRLADIKRPTDQNFIIDKVIGMEMVKSMDWLSRKTEKEDVKLIIDEKGFTFVSGDCEVHSPFINGNYPETSRLIPSSFSTEFKVSKKALEDAMKHLSIFRQDKIAICNMTIEDGKALLSSRDPESGEASEEIEGELKGEELHISFNIGYLQDALKVIEGENITLKLNGEMKPFILQSDKPETKDDIHLMLPVRSFD